VDDVAPVADEEEQVFVGEDGNEAVEVVDGGDLEEHPLVLWCVVFEMLEEGGAEEREEVGGTEFAGVLLVGADKAALHAEEGRGVLEEGDLPQLAGVGVEGGVAAEALADVDRAGAGHNAVDDDGRCRRPAAAWIVFGTEADEDSFGAGSD
jgi:hypothetical protein